jgi:hypothetical protein
MPRIRIDREQIMAWSRSHIDSLRRNAALFGLDQSTRYRRHIGIAVNISLVILFAVLLYTNQTTLPLLIRVMTPAILGACFVFYLSSFLLQFVVWAGLMGYRRAEMVDGLQSYVGTIFMGRLPGGVWKLIGRMTVYKAPQHSLRAVVAINIAEIGIAIFTNFVLLLFLVDLHWYLRVIGLTGVLVIGLLARQAGGATLMQYKLPSWLLWVGCYMLAWVFGALMVYAIVGAFGVKLPILVLLRFWCLAGAAGILLQVLPLSSLVRDMTLVAMLQSSMPIASAVVAGFAMRLFLSMCELLSGWLILGLLWLMDHGNQEASEHISRS